MAIGVNVTDFAAPNAKARNTTLVDPHVVAMSHDFTWPSNGNISSALNGSTDTFCIANLGTFEMPANVTNTYTEDDTKSPDCVPALDSACVGAIVRGDGGHGSDCHSGTAWTELPECASTLGYTTKQSTGVDNEVIILRRGLIGSSTNNQSTSGSVEKSGDAIWGLRTAASNGTNTTSYENAANLLQIMLINAGGVNPQLLCMRVNTTQLPVHDDKMNAANPVRYSPVAALVVAMAWTLLASMYMI